ncbi:MAG: 23S rRNA (pseudouridine(1915)-N(3))-methyltransferase RlmH [Oscillospiraceae bacterium]|jgi:23S rRNA (pseudouridine1915-N3)-methyltransferase|nr:23S rRNA (pseudouridine(1915)-N(3))-methyltransferase RlmH [Oscillospiraceae bacterium]
MQRVTVICVGRLKEKFYISAVSEYVKRLGRYCRLEIIELPEQRLPENPAPAEIERALAKEAEAVRARLPNGAALAALCVEGELRSSEELAALLERQAGAGEKGLAFVIGGSYGLHPSVKAQAWLRLSMSPMTFPHHLARVMLLEQLYRSFQIREGGKYHK